LENAAPPLSKDRGFRRVGVFMKKENLIKIDKSKALELILNYMINKYGFNSLKRIKELQNLLRRFNLKERRCNLAKSI